MTVFLPIIIPLLGALLIISFGSSVRRCTGMLAATGLLHLASTVLLLYRPTGNEYLGADSMGFLVLALASILFFFVSWHIRSWLPAT